MIRETGKSNTAKAIKELKTLLDQVLESGGLIKKGDQIVIHPHLDRMSEIIHQEEMAEILILRHQAKPTPLLYKDKG